MALQAELVEAADDEVAAFAILVTHVEHRITAIPERLDGSFLAHDGSAHDTVLVNLEHPVDNGGRAAGVTDTEASHREGLREAVKEDRAFAHARQ